MTASTPSVTFRPPLEHEQQRLTCTRCGRSELVAADEEVAVGTWSGIAATLGFELTSQRLELFGRCAACGVAARWGEA
jgi:Fe2+ or Zn2+ uptake regulation protein